jgi:hypothetical protein
MAITNNQCAICSKPGKLCASCENIHYCGPACQKTDWKIHKLLCRTFKDFRDPPGPMMMRVIAFHVSSIKPEFRWMPIKKGTIQRPIVDEYFGHDNPLTGFVSFPLDPITGAQLPLRLTIQSRDKFMTDGSLPNRALYQLTEGTLCQPFAGPVLIYGNTLTSHDDTILYVNLDTTHLNLIKSWFTHGFYISPNHKLYRQNFERDTKWWKFGISREAANAMGKEILAKGGEVPNFKPEEFGTPEFCLWHDKVGRYKQEWMVRKQREEVAKAGKEAAGDFPEQLGEEEEAWRSEMRVGGRVIGLDVVLP